MPIVTPQFVALKLYQELEVTLPHPYCLQSLRNQRTLHQHQGWKIGDESQFLPWWEEDLLGLSPGYLADGSGLQLAYIKLSICDLTKLMNFPKAQGTKDKSSKIPMKGPKRVGSRVLSQGAVENNFYTNILVSLCCVFSLLNQL